MFIAQRLMPNALLVTACRTSLSAACRVRQAVAAGGPGGAVAEFWTGACPDGCSLLRAVPGGAVVRRGSLGPCPGDRWPGHGCRMSLAWLLPVPRCCPRGVRRDEYQLLRRAVTGP